MSGNQRIGSDGTAVKFYDSSAGAHDDRARGLIQGSWVTNLCQCWHVGSPGKLDNALEATRQLHEAGVDILAGTDAAGIGIFGTAHGVRCMVKSSFSSRPA